MILALIWNHLGSQVGAILASKAAPAGSTLMWVNAKGEATPFGPLFGGNAHSHHCMGVCQSSDREQTVATVQFPEGPLRSLTDIPADSWEYLDIPPPEGYK